MNNRRICRVRDVMEVEFDLIDRMATIDDALRNMKHVDNKVFIALLGGLFRITPITLGSSLPGRTRSGASPLPFFWGAGMTKGSGVTPRSPSPFSKLLFVSTATAQPRLSLAPLMNGPVRPEP